MLNIKTGDLLATHIVACEQAFCLGKGYAMKKFLSSRSFPQTESLFTGFFHSTVIAIKMNYKPQFIPK